ncbi:MAG: thioredoxin-dependent thiol peroxidase [Bacteroidia bacterium]|nr:thioredoxin-dependent thiol peroxidase [Bacteroidia bacterium]
MNTILAGNTVPGLSGKDQSGNTISLSQFKGRKVVLFFYPEDDTPTCTKEACNLRDNYGLLKSKGLEVIGVSIDNETSHQKFIGKYDLPFPLIADEDKTWVEAYGAWGEKNMYGKKYMGTHRVTFLINEEGVISHVIKKVKSDNHAQQILDLLGLS